jgi:hypothetical protein
MPNTVLLGENNMKLRLNELEQILNKKIAWCEEHYAIAEPLYQKGFVMGIKHALEVLKDAEEGIKDGQS